MFEVDLDRFRTLCEDAKVTPVLAPGPAHRYCIGIEGGASDLVTFLFTVVPYLDDHWELIDDQQDFRPEWQQVEERTVDGARWWVWPEIRPVRALAETQ